MRDAEAAYVAMEQELQSDLDNYERTHSYDEYHYDLDDIEHDPYVLMSILSALHPGEWTLADVEDTLGMLFEKQCIQTETVTTETRYRTETVIKSVMHEIPRLDDICTTAMATPLWKSTRMRRKYLTPTTSAMWNSKTLTSATYLSTL
jgi:hypothetical protein